MDQIDRAIDTVTEEMIASEPDPGFKARVLARIEGVDDRRGCGRWAWVLSSLCVAGAVILLVVASDWMPRRWAPTAARTGASVRADAALKTGTAQVRPRPDTTYHTATFDPATSGVATNGASRRGVAAGPALTPTQRTATLPMAAEPTATGVSTIAPLAPPPLDLEEIGVEVMAVEAMEPMESIGLSTLGVAPLEVPSL